MVYDGGVFIGPIFGDMLATLHNQTQVSYMFSHLSLILQGCVGPEVSQVFGYFVLTLLKYQDLRRDIS